MNINKITSIFIVILLFFGVYCSSIIGISWDEPSSNSFALAKINFIKTFGQNTDYLRYYENHNPGFYSTILAFISNLFPHHIVYEVRHLINLLLSLLTLLGVYLVVKDNFDKRLGLLTVLLCLLNPFFFGLMSITVRDIPVCFSYIWTIYFFSKYVKNFFRTRIKYVILLGLVIGFGLGTRIAFIVNLFPLFLISIVFLIIYKNKINLLSEIKFFFLESLIIIFSSTLIIFSFWIFAYDEGPIRALLLAIAETLNLLEQLGPPTDIIKGNIYNTINTPRTYLLSYFLGRFPIFLIILFIISFFIIIGKKNYLSQKYNNFNLKIYSNLFIFLFPILIIILLKVKLYDGIRLLLFVIPFFSLLTAISINYLLENFNTNKLSKIGLVVIFFTFLPFLERYVRLTPYQYDFTNYSHISFANSKNFYQHDYWAISYKELIKKIKNDERFKEKKFSVSVCGGDIWQIVNEFSKDKVFRKNVTYISYLAANKADYVFLTGRLGIGKYQNIKCFDRFEGQDLYSAGRLGVTYSVLREIKK